MATTNGTPSNGIYTIRLNASIKLAIISAFLFVVSTAFALISNSIESHGFIQVWTAFVSILALAGTVATFIVALIYAFDK